MYKLLHKQCSIFQSLIRKIMIKSIHYVLYYMYNILCIYSLSSVSSR